MADDAELPRGDEEMAEAGSDSDSSDSDFEELDISPEDTRLLLKLEQQLKENPNLYDSHVQFIEVLRRCKMTTRLREARQTMHAAFPLTEALWFDWLSDEIEGVEDADDVERIRDLMGEAVRDYLSVPLWAQYLEFVRDFDPEVTGGSAEGRARMRGLCEEALTAGGLHVSAGGRLWSIFRGYEQALLEAEPGEEQRERVRALWARQLGVPLADGAATLAAYEEWEARGAAEGGGGNPGFTAPAALASEAGKARAAAELRQPYEEAVGAGRPADADLLAAYMAYIKVEERAGDPARVQVVYERGVAAFPVTHYLWLQYGRYLEAHLRIGSVVNSVYARAVRNCPWVGALWARALRALERSGAPEEQQAALFERALSAGLQGYEDYLEVSLARADALRRRGPEAAAPLRAAFTRAAELLQSYFPDHLDRSFRLTSYWAECEAGVGGDLAAARKVWEAALKGAAGRYADTWAAYIDFERRRGNSREARTLYKRCYSRRLEEGGQAIMCDAWLRFEREEGSAEDHLAACLKVEPILQELQAAAAAAADPGHHAVARTAASNAAQLSREEVRALRQQADPNYGKRKQRGAEQAERAAPPAKSDGEMMPPPAKKPKPQPAAEAEAAAGPGGPAAEQPPPLQQQQPAADAHQQAEAEQEGVQQHAAEVQRAQQGSDRPAGDEGGRPAKGGGLGWRQQRRTDASTAFVKHLAEGVDEAAVRQLFESCGEVTAVEMGRDRATGRMKGFAYVHFASQQGLQAACRLDRTEYRGKHIFVAPSRPPGGGGHREGQALPQQAQGRGGPGGGEDVGRGRGRGGGGAAGRGRGRGGRDGGRGRGGAAGRHRNVVDLGGGQPASQGEGPSAPPRAFVPRAAALQGKKGGGEGQPSGEGAAGGAPKSNDEFRKMFLGGK